MLKTGGDVADKSHRRRVGELKSHFPPQDGIETSFLRKSALAFDGVRTSVIGPVAPLSDIEVVNAPARDHAQRELAHILMIVALELVLVEGSLRRRSNPAIPIQIIRRCLLREERALPAAGRGHRDFAQLAQAAIQCKLASPAELWVG